MFVLNQLLFFPVVLDVLREACHIFADSTENKTKNLLPKKRKTEGNSFVEGVAEMSDHAAPLSQISLCFSR